MGTGKPKSIISPVLADPKMSQTKGKRKIVELIREK
jgi:hypothetical protein